jgi:AcrR family transcriptional regulator
MTQFAKTASAGERPRRTQAERRDESERGLVKAAIAVICEDGVSAATFEAIARRGGYSRGLVSQRFGSKQGLIEAVIDYLHDQADLRQEGRKADELTGLEALLAHVDRYCEMLSGKGENQAYFRLLSSAVADISVLQATFAEEHGRVGARLMAFVRGGQADGSIRPEIDAKAAALMVGSFLLGLSMQVLIDPSMDLDPIWATSLASLRLAFAAPGAAATGPLG